MIGGPTGLLRRLLTERAPLSEVIAAIQLHAECSHIPRKVEEYDALFLDAPRRRQTRAVASELLVSPRTAERNHQRRGEAHKASPTYARLGEYCEGLLPGLGEDAFRAIVEANKQAVTDDEFEARHVDEAADFVARIARADHAEVRSLFSTLHERPRDVQRYIGDACLDRLDVPGGNEETLGQLAIANELQRIAFRGDDHHLRRRAAAHLELLASGGPFSEGIAIIRQCSDAWFTRKFTKAWEGPPSRKLVAFWDKQSQSILKKLDDLERSFAGSLLKDHFAFAFKPFENVARVTIAATAVDRSRDGAGRNFAERMAIARAHPYSEFMRSTLLRAEGLSFGRSVDIDGGISLARKAIEGAQGYEFGLATMTLSMLLEMEWSVRHRAATGYLSVLEADNAANFFWSMGKRNAARAAFTRVTRLAARLLKTGA